jgi:hypothetical protein
MGGQGFLLADLAFRGANVWLGDINPALCLLATLRSPAAINKRAMLFDRIEEKLKALKATRRPATGASFVDDWIPKNIAVELQSYRDLFAFSHDPFKFGGPFWKLPLHMKFAAALPILAAREIACFRSSDNQTWIKPGGLQREHHIAEPLRRALAAWLDFANERAASAHERSKWGALCSQRMDAASGQFGFSVTADAIITSPPYANRLDYTRMWGPETQVAASMWGSDVRGIQSRQIGSNVVRGLDNSREDLQTLPSQVQDALSAIRTDKDYASEGYYFPFFKNYAISLMNTVQQIGANVRNGGTAIFFVRDTVRKDVLFPTGLLIEEVMKGAGFLAIGKERHVVKRHVGLRRRGSASGLYGVGQLEWWLAFERAKK